MFASRVAKPVTGSNPSRTEALKPGGRARPAATQKNGFVDHARPARVSRRDFSRVPLHAQVRGQAALEVVAPGDPLEREIDRVPERVIHTSQAAPRLDTSVSAASIKTTPTPSGNPNLAAA